MDETRSAPTRRPARREPGSLEAHVLTALWRASEPVSAGWVRETVDPSLAYTTVVTTLARLEVKRAVARNRVGRGYVWWALVDDAGLAALRMNQVLERVNDRQGVLSRFVADLSPGDEQELRNRLAAFRPSAEVGER